MDDAIYLCLYCGELMELSEKQIKIFGKPKCCDHGMTSIDRRKIYDVIKALEKLKINLENKTIEGVLDPI